MLHMLIVHRRFKDILISDKKENFIIVLSEFVMQNSSDEMKCGVTISFITMIHWLCGHGG